VRSASSWRWACAAAIRGCFWQGVVIGLRARPWCRCGFFVLAACVNRGQWIHLDPSIYYIDHLPVHTQPSDVLVWSRRSLIVPPGAALSADPGGAARPRGSDRYE